jgi:hypothetical protein
MELKKLLSLLGNERGCGPFERSGEKAPIDEGSSDARSMRRIFSRALLFQCTMNTLSLSMKLQQLPEADADALLRLPADSES